MTLTDIGHPSQQHLFSRIIFSENIDHSYSGNYVLKLSVLYSCTFRELYFNFYSTEARVPLSLTLRKFVLLTQCTCVIFTVLTIDGNYIPELH